MVEPTQEPRPRRVVSDSLWLVIGVLPVVLVAFVVFHLIRAHVLERYLVPSSSMEPALHGDPVEGDVVLVDKTGLWRGAPRRWDMVVLRNRHDAEHTHLVKRVVAFGEELVEVAHGDVFVSEPGTTELRLLRKSLAEARPMRATWFRWPGSERRRQRVLKSSAAWAPTADGQGLRLEAAGEDPAALQRLLTVSEQQQRRTGRERDLSLYVPGHLSTAEPVTATFVDSRGLLHSDPAPARDIGIEATIRPQPGCTGLQLVVEHRDEYFAFVYAADGAVRLTTMGVETLASAPHPAPALVAGADRRIAFGYLDGRFFLEVDGAPILEVDRDLPTGIPTDFRFPGPRLENLLHVASAGAAAEVRGLRIFHDVHYDSVDGPVGTSWPRIVPRDHLWLMGDNSRYSRDSRDPQIGAYPEADLVGRPVAVIAPWSRMRWIGSGH